MKESTQEVFDICNACRFASTHVYDDALLDPEITDGAAMEEYVIEQFGDFAELLDEAREIAETRTARRYIAETSEILAMRERDARERIASEF